MSFRRLHRIWVLFQDFLKVLGMLNLKGISCFVLLYWELRCSSVAVMYEDTTGVMPVTEALSNDFVASFQFDEYFFFMVRSWAY